ncbi:MAG TPA: efflux RND transporter periplasmic adaptor subunit, partial [Chitinophagales bacterium]|nr:efflux RND transporter periplasmic adaptor subunit [Chitinophagales bacterium]
VYNKVIKPKENAAPGPVAGQATAMTVEGYIVKPRNIDNEIIASGTLLANEQINVQAEVQGKVVQLNLNEGSAVTKGTVLVKLFDDDLQAQLQKLQAQEETDIKTESRLKQLLAINGIGQQEYDNAVTALKGVRADIEYTKALISKTEIVAPFNGVIGLRNISLGAVVSPGTVIATLQQIDPLKIDFVVPEKYASQLSRGDDFTLTVDGYKEKFKGKVYAVEPQIDETTRSMTVRGLVQNSSSKLFPGTYARVDLGLKQIQNALMVPTQCVIPQARTKQIIVLKDGKAMFKDVETDIRDESSIQITNNAIQPGDTVITTAIMYIKPGMDLKVTKINN